MGADESRLVLILFVWRNSQMIDLLYYRLVDELKYER
jgi:hypothetical protein